MYFGLLATLLYYTFVQVCSTCLLQKRCRIEVKEECRHAKDTSSIILSEATDSKLGILQTW